MTFCLVSPLLLREFLNGEWKRSVVTWNLPEKCFHFISSSTILCFNIIDADMYIIDIVRIICAHISTEREPQIRGFKAGLSDSCLGTCDLPLSVEWLIGPSDQGTVSCCNTVRCVVSTEWLFFHRLLCTTWLSFYFSSACHIKTLSSRRSEWCGRIENTNGIGA